MRKWEYAYLVTSSTLSVPAIRMVIVEAFAWKEKPEEPLQSDAGFYPVIALESRLIHRYSKRFVGNGMPPPHGADHAEMLEFGWHYEGQSLDVGAVYVPEAEAAIFSTLDEFTFADNCRWRVMVCQWDTSEDEQRLSKTMDELKAEAVKSVEERERKRE